MGVFHTVFKDVDILISSPMVSSECRGWMERAGSGGRRRWEGSRSCIVGSG